MLGGRNEHGVSRYQEINDKGKMVSVPPVNGSITMVASLRYHLHAQSTYVLRLSTEVEVIQISWRELS
jgi:hypothetical protein